MGISKQQLEAIFYHEGGRLYWNEKRGSKIKKHMRAGTMNKKYLRVLFDGVRMYNHQVIFFLHYGYLPKNIDHKDRDTLHNHPSNLRESTPAQNAANRGMRSNNTTGYKGVSFHKQSNRYQAELEVNGTRIYLGIFPTPEQAAIKYNESALANFGEFANLNKIISHGN